MNPAELVQGAIIEAMSFDDVPFKITIQSSGAVGCGGSAMVFKGQIVNNAKPWSVAVKVLKDNETNSIQQELLARELRAARRVYDERILLYFARLVASPYQAIISLFMENGNMLEYLKGNDSADQASLIIQVAEAVCYLHDTENLVHGDLKCANVLISDHGTAVLGDFGLSTAVEDSSSAGTTGASASALERGSPSSYSMQLLGGIDPVTFEEKTRSGETTASGIRNLYTLRFAAPEILFGSERGATRKTRASDVFAFGMLVLEAITQQAPWAGMNALSVVQSVGSGLLPSRPKDGDTILSDAWWNICVSCWAFTPASRPTMQRVNEELVIHRPEPLLVSQKENCAVAGTTQDNDLTQEPSSWSVDIMTCLIYTPCGRRVVSGSQDRTIKVWDCASGKTVLGPLEGHTGPVYAVAISPDGSQIASSGGDGTIRRWDARSGAPVGRPISRHVKSVTCIAYSHDGTCIVSGSHNGTLRLWDARTGKSRGKLLHNHPAGYLGDVAFSPDDSCLVSMSCSLGWGFSESRSATIFHLAQEIPGRDTHLPSFPQRERTIFHAPLRAQISFGPVDQAYRPMLAPIAISPSGTLIASAMVDSTILTWNTETRRPVGSWKMEAGQQIRMLSFSPDEKSVASLTDTGHVHFWELDQALPHSGFFPEPMFGQFEAENSENSSVLQPLIR